MKKDNRMTGRRIFFASICTGMAVLLSGCNKANSTSNSEDISEEPTNIPFVDLGLPSEVKWAAWNFGADAPEEQGISLSGYEAKEIDAKFLKSRCPTMAELEELLDKSNCKWTYVKNYNGSGIDGYQVTGKRKGYTDRSIFIPGVCRRDTTEGKLYTTTLYDSEDIPEARLGMLNFQWDNKEDSKISLMTIRGIHPWEKLPVRLVSRDIDRKYLLENHVNLGLSSRVKWGRKNVGADYVQSYGEYFAWGETDVYYTPDWKGGSHETPKPEQWKEGYGRGYIWFTYKFTKGYDDDDNLPGPDDITKYTDSTLKTLKPEDDAATALLGEPWRMPTDAEVNELYDECYWQWTENYNSTGVAGYIVFKSHDKYSDHGLQRECGNPYKINKDYHIFLPAAGCLLDTIFQESTRHGYYWTSSLDLDQVCGAHYLDFDDYEVFGRQFLNIGYRFYGQPIRPVYDDGGK